MKKIQLLMLLFPAYTSMAQTKKMCSDSSISFSVYHNIGVSVQEFDDINNRVNSYQQYKTLPEVIGTLGMGSVVQKGHFVGVNGFTVAYAMNGNKEKKSSTLAFLGLSADVGYNIFDQHSRAELYPTAGLGLEGYRARFNKDLSDVSFNDVLNSNTEQNNTRSVTFYNCYVTYRFGLNLAFKSRDASGAIGLQAGYTGGFKDRPWKINYNQLLKDSPSDNLSRFYANLFMTKNLNWGHKRMM